MRRCAVRLCNDRRVELSNHVPRTAIFEIGPLDNYISCEVFRHDDPDSCSNVKPGIGSTLLHLEYIHIYVISRLNDNNKLQYTIFTV